MSRKDSLIAKLKLLGYSVEIVDTNCIVSTRPDGYKQIIDNNGLISSDLYETVNHLDGTEYSIVSINNQHGIVLGSQSIMEVMRYDKLSKPIQTSSKKYNIVAKMIKGMYGVIDLNDNTIVQFKHSSIEVYKTRKGIIYVGYIQDKTIIYNVNGEVLGVSSKLKYSFNIFGYDFILDCNKCKGIRRAYDIDIYNLNGDNLYSYKSCILDVSSNGLYVIRDKEYNILIKDIEKAIEYK